MLEKECGLQRKEEVLFALVEREDIVGKKVTIYSRLLTDPALAKAMEGLALRH